MLTGTFEWYYSELDNEWHLNCGDLIVERVKQVVTPGKVNVEWQWMWRFFNDPEEAKKHVEKLLKLKRKEA